MADEMIDVRYVGNADPRDRTGAIWPTGRERIYMGEVGKLTEAEISIFSSRGHVIETVTKEELKAPATHDHGGGMVHEHPLDFSSMSAESLQSQADAHGMTVEGTGRGGSVTKSDLETALANAHA